MEIWKIVSAFPQPTEVIYLVSSSCSHSLGICNICNVARQVSRIEVLDRVVVWRESDVSSSGVACPLVYTIDKDIENRSVGAR